MANTQEIANEVRDIINWVAVFQKEYDLPQEIATQLQRDWKE